MVCIQRNHRSGWIYKLRITYAFICKNNNIGHQYTAIVNHKICYKSSIYIRWIQTCQITICNISKNICHIFVEICCGSDIIKGSTCLIGNILHVIYIQFSIIVKANRINRNTKRSCLTKSSCQFCIGFLYGSRSIWKVCVSITEKNNHRISVSIEGITLF